MHKGKSHNGHSKAGHDKLTSSEKVKAVDAAERHKYDKSHKPMQARKGNKRATAKKSGSRLSYD